MRPRRPRGVSIVELLVGLALGLFIVAIGLSLLVGRIHEHRALLLQSRLMQDLRVAAEIVTRDLRRAGHWNEANAAIWHGSASGAAPNPQTALTTATDTIRFRFSPTDASANDSFGFRLHGGSIEMLLGDGAWQALTDSGSVVVTAFHVSPRLQEIALHGFCANPCPSGAPQCLPRQQVRSVAVTISGRAVADGSVVRTLRSEVRLRNDAIVGRCPA
ncbi:MAG TPA: hypothetical protein VGP22_01030 [Albitalea sp.]|jgi:type IV pilus assembly protein PilW|nr:hypothetical protein [Albitalea sp.]